jgi:hypothetical protein
MFIQRLEMGHDTLTYLEFLPLGAGGYQTVVLSRALFVASGANHLRDAIVFPPYSDMMSLCRFLALQAPPGGY